MFTGCRGRVRDGGHYFPVAPGGKQQSRCQQKTVTRDKTFDLNRENS